MNLKGQDPETGEMLDMDIYLYIKKYGITAGKYIEFVADRLSCQLGGEKIYNSVNPFDWMEMISMDGKTNFFEKRVGEYSLATKIDNIDDAFDFNLNF